MSNHCLVTGASGFLGKYLLACLQQKKWGARALVRSAFNGALSCEQVVVGDLSASGASETWFDGIDTVFYLAGTAHLSAEAKQYEEDHSAVLRLARLAAQQGVKRFVFVSTTKAAADPAANICNESWDAWPTEPYGYWKRKTEEQLVDVAIPHIALVRPCLMYGAGVKGNLQKMINAIDRGYFPPLLNTSAQRSMVFAGDVAEALLLAATHSDANRRPLIVADKEPYTVSDLYAAIRNALGKAPAKWHIPLSWLQAVGAVGDSVKTLGVPFPVNRSVVARLTENVVYSSDKLQQLGWTPSTTFYRELPNMISALQHHA